jgi:hypothetical protein
MQERLETKMVPKGQRRHDVPLYGRLLGGKGGRGNGLVVTIYLAMVCLTTQSRNHPLYAVGINCRLLLGSTVSFCWDRPSALAGIDRRLLLGSTVGSCWDRPSARSPVTESTIKRTNTRDVGVRRSSTGDVLEIDRKLQGELC